jgi:hypothetical protein
MSKATRTMRPPQELRTVFLSKNEIGVEFSGTWEDARSDMSQLLGGYVARAIGETISTHGVTVMEHPTRPLAIAFYDPATSAINVQVEAYVLQGDGDAFAAAIGYAVKNAIQSTPGWPDQWIRPSKSPRMAH